MKLHALGIKLATLLELMRLRNAGIAFFGVLVGAILSPLAASKASIILAGISAAFILAGGNAINDYFDVEIDRVNKPKRPLPSGRISTSDTLMISLVLFLVGVGMSKYLNSYCLILASFNSILLIVYAKYSKKMLFTANLVVSYLVASVFLYGATVTIPSGTVALDVSQFKMTLILAACAFLMTLSREIIKDIEDVEGDRRQYSTTLPIVIGPEKSKRIAVAVGILAIAASALPILTQIPSFDARTYLPTIAVADMVFLISFTKNTTLNQRLIVFGMVLSLIAFFLGKTL